MPTGTFRFYEELNEFLPKHRNKVDFEAEFNGRKSIKDIIKISKHDDKTDKIRDGISGCEAFPNLKGGFCLTTVFRAQVRISVYFV
mgnify:CR=1 FL=1